MIPYGRQTVSEEDIAAVTAVLKSDFLTQGPVTPAFESALAEYCGASGAVAVNSATSALHLACMALGLGEGDYLWTSPISFVASANCGRYCGATVDFVDIDPTTANLCPDALQQKLKLAAIHGCLPKILVVVHLSGNPCDLASIKSLADEYDVRLIEDASHALGASYQGEKIGGCRFSDITVFSFHPVKIITSGEGGAALSNDPALLASMRLLREHGITKDSDQLKYDNRLCEDDGYCVDEYCGDWYYEQQALGWNYRMTDIHAALGMNQLLSCDRWIDQRHKLARQYQDRLSSLPCTPLSLTPGAYSSYHLFIIQVAAHERGRLYQWLRSAGIGVQVHYIPVHRQPYYQAQGFNPGDFPKAEQYYLQTLSLPVFPSLSSADVDKVLSTLETFWQ